MDINFYIKNVLVPPPENWQQLEFECSFTNDKDEASIRVGVLKWMAENAATLNKWLQDGLFGGPGIFEGPPLRIEITNGITTIVAFSGCVDMRAAEARFTCDIIEAPAREAEKIDWLNDVADSVEFSVLADIGQITSADYVPVPYVISTIPDGPAIALLGLGVYSMIRELAYIVEKTTALIAEIAGDANPLTIGAIIADIIKITLYVVYLIAVMAALLQLLRAIFDHLIQDLKYKYGMKVKTLFEKACSYLGIPFSSTLLNTYPYNQAVIVPKKTAKITNPSFNQAFFSTNGYSRKDYDDTKNPKAYGYYEGSFKELILAMNEVFNAKPVILDNGITKTLHYEVWDYFNNTASVIIDPVGKDAPFQDPYGTNASELASNYEVIFAIDEAESNTYDNYDGTSTQMILEPIIVQNSKNNLLKGLHEANIEFALAKRKIKFTVPEEVYQFFYSIVRDINNAVTSFANDIIKALNKVAKLIGKKKIQTIPLMATSAIANRLNAMLLQTDFTSVQKLMICDASGYLDPLGDTYMSARYLMDNFHAHSFAISSLPAPNDHNQYLTYTDKTIPLCLTDFIKIKGNNIVKDAQGRFGRIDSMRWNPFTETANIDYRIKQKYTNNLKQRFVVDGV